MQCTGKSFSDLYHAHFDFVWRSLRRFGVTAGDLDDAAQEVFVVLLRKQASIDPERPVRAWLFAVVRRVASRFRRGNSRRARLNAAVDATPAVSTRGADPRATVDPIEAYDRREAIQLLDQFLDELTPAQREVFVLAELEQLSGVEISALLETNQNTIWSRLRSARRAFDRRFGAIQAEHRRLHQHTDGRLERRVLSLSRRSHEPAPEDRRRVGAALGVPLLVCPGGTGGEVVAGGPAAVADSLGPALPSASTGLATRLPVLLASTPVRAGLAALVLVGGAVGVDSLREQTEHTDVAVAQAVLGGREEDSAELDPSLLSLEASESTRALPSESGANTVDNRDPSLPVDNAGDRDDAPRSALERMLASGGGGRSEGGGTRRAAVGEEAASEPVLDPEAGSEGDLDAELGLLVQTREALASGRPERALRRAELHARRFPEGALAQEREGLRISALCELGRKTEASRLAEALQRQLGSANAVRRFTSACES